MPVDVAAVAVASAVFAGIGAFRNGHDMFTRWREKRREMKKTKNLLSSLPAAQSNPSLNPTFSLPPPPPDLSLPLSLLLLPPDEPSHTTLSLNLVSSPRHVQSEYTKLLAAAGPLFQRGDDISIQQLMGGLARFQQNLIYRIRSAMITASAVGLLMIGGLISETDLFRNMNISSMTDLFQRVNVARPIVRLLQGGVASASSSVGGPGSGSGSSSTTTSTCWCRAVVGRFSCAYCGRAG